MFLSKTSGNIIILYYNFTNNHLKMCQNILFIIILLGEKYHYIVSYMTFMK